MKKYFKLIVCFMLGLLCFTFSACNEKSQDEKPDKGKQVEEIKMPLDSIKGITFAYSDEYKIIDSEVMYSNFSLVLNNLDKIDYELSGMSIPDGSRAYYYLCPVCKKTFATNSHEWNEEFDKCFNDLAEHIVHEHNIENNTCPCCNIDFMQNKRIESDDPVLVLADHLNPKSTRCTYYRQTDFQVCSEPGKIDSTKDLKEQITESAKEYYKVVKDDFKWLFNEQGEVKISNFKYSIETREGITYLNVFTNDYSTNFILDYNDENKITCISHISQVPHTTTFFFKEPVEYNGEMINSVSIMTFRTLKVVK